MNSPQWITPDWPVPPNVRAAATLRAGGVSKGSFASFNLGAHVGDDAGAVAENRRLLRAALDLPAEPTWLNQVHGTAVVTAGATQESPPSADASVALKTGAVCVVLTADCLPVLFCNRAGTRIGAAHAGWRGLVGGVLAETIRALDVSPADLLAWMGPAIETDAFEVGSEVREQFVARDASNAAAFENNARGRWQADLYRLARNELTRLGVTNIHGGGFQCFADSERFFSYRRDTKTGRMATLIWMT
ncbi:MAG: peptidoglycan editing factor PgeF [Steroidobacter sp.]